MLPLGPEPDCPKGCISSAPFNVFESVNQIILRAIAVGVELENQSESVWRNKIHALLLFSTGITVQGVVAECAETRLRPTGLCSSSSFCSVAGEVDVADDRKIRMGGDGAACFLPYLLAD